MATIQPTHNRKGQRRYRVRVRLAGRYASKTTKTRAEATRFAAEMETTFLLKRRDPLACGEAVTFGEIVARYERTVLPRKKMSTQRQQLQQLDWWVSQIGALTPLSRLHPDLIATAADKLLPRSGATVNRYLALLSHLCNRAVREWRVLHDNPVKMLDRHREGRGRARWLRPEERKRLLYACATSSNRMLYAAVMVALSTGARKGEVMGAEWDRCDLYLSTLVDGVPCEMGRILIDNGKTEERRALILTGEALTLMRERYQQRVPGARWCFPALRDPKRPAEIRRAWEAALVKARLENFCFHDLRHSAASYLGAQGASLAQIGAVLGHISQATTQRYTHFVQSAGEAIVSRMNSAVFRR